MPTTILLADDHEMVREGLRRILETRDDLAVVAQAGDGEEAVQQAAQARPDLALLDISMPRLSGIEAIRRIRELGGPTRCIAVSMHDSAGYVTEALRAGASGYVVKSSAASELFQAIDAVVAGRRFVSQAVAHHLVDAMVRGGEPCRSPVANLSARERQVLRLIAEGHSSREIAARLGISQKTVETHRGNLMSKLKVRKASLLVRVAIHEGVVEL